MRNTSRVPVTAAVLAAVHLVFLSGAIAFGAESIVTNGDFQKWTDGVLDGWKLEIGSTNGAEAPKSVVKLIKGPALMLRGDASTMAWHTVSQRLPVRPGGSYRLEFESRTRDIKREGRQFDNCYVGFWSVDGRGKPVQQKVDDVAGDNTDWKQHQIDFTVPQAAASTSVMIFLSKSGILGVKNVTVTPTGDAPPPEVKPTTDKPATDEPATDEPAKTPSLLTNGDFKAWTKGRPDGWKVDVGANNGADQPTSQIMELSEPGVALRGAASTRAWYSLGQQVPVRKGGAYTLEFQALSSGIQRQGRQFDNCYVGVIYLDSAGKKVDMPVKDLSRVSRWGKFKLNLTVPPNAAKTEVLIFLSKSGTLSIKDLRLKEATPRRPF